MTSHANSRAGSVVAAAVTSAAAAKINIRPWKRALDSWICPAEKTNTSSVTTATVGSISAARASTARPKSAPATNEAVTSGRVPAAIRDSTTVIDAVTTETGVANRSARRLSASTAPPTAGATGSSHNASSGPLIG